LVIHKNITAQKLFERETMQSSRHITKLSRHLVAVQEDARRRLAAELHDLTSPSLAAIGINFEVAEIALREGNLAELSVRIEDNNALIQETAENIRDICADLRPPALDYAGLLPACEAYIERFSKRFGIKSSLESQAGVRLPPEIESLLFRIFQEALTNVAKHAAASTVNVRLHIANYPLMLSISDDGNGFDLGKLGGEAGLGVLNMRGMTDFVGGLFDIQSVPGQGTHICVQIFSPRGAP
jgi:signal transduction histidine kinase